MGQQHRVRTKRKRRLAYLERKKTARNAKRSKPKTAKKAASASAEA